MSRYRAVKFSCQNDVMNAGIDTPHQQASRGEEWGGGIPP